MVGVGQFGRQSGSKSNTARAPKWDKKKSYIGVHQGFKQTGGYTAHGRDGGEPAPEEINSRAKHYIV